jgi:hypothetical protein
MLAHQHEVDATCDRSHTHIQSVPHALPIQLHTHKSKEAGRVAGQTYTQQLELNTTHMTIHAHTLAGSCACGTHISRGDAQHVACCRSIGTYIMCSKGPLQRHVAGALLQSPAGAAGSCKTPLKVQGPAKPCDTILKAAGSCRLERAKTEGVPMHTRTQCVEPEPNRQGYCTLPDPPPDPTHVPTHT